MYKVLLLSLLISSPTYGQTRQEVECDELWVARNAMINRAGYCFQSPLGKAIFDNSDCTTTSPTLSRIALMMIENIEATEAQMGCHVDTNNTAGWENFHFSWGELLEVDILPDRPRDEFDGLTCIGYMGAPLNLYSAPDSGAEPIAHIENGAVFNFAHGFYRNSNFHPTSDATSEDDMGWYFINWRTGKDISRAGWVYAPIEGVFIPQIEGGKCYSMAG